jgi:hypothetical protein
MDQMDGQNDSDDTFLRKVSASFVHRGTILLFPVGDLGSSQSILAMK